MTGPLVKDWLNLFMGRHAQRHVIQDWPDPRSEEWDDLFRCWLMPLAKRNVSEAEANDASMTLAENPPRFGKDHLPALIGQIETTRALAAASGSKGFAEVSSKGCPYCRGEGLVVVFSALPGDRSRDDRRIPDSVAAYCVCPKGRWTMQNHANNPETAQVGRGTPDFQRVLDGRSYWRQFAHGTEPDDAESMAASLAKEYAQMSFPRPEGRPGMPASMAVSPPGGAKGPRKPKVRVFGPRLHEG